MNQQHIQLLCNSLQSGLQQWAIKDSITQENLSLVTFLYDHSLLTIIEQASGRVTHSHFLHFTYICDLFMPLSYYLQMKQCKLTFFIE